MKNTKRIIKGLLDKVLFNRVLVNNDKNEYPYGGTSVQAVDIDWNDAQVHELDENGKPKYDANGNAYFKTITTTGNLLEYIQEGTITGTNHILLQMTAGNDKLSQAINQVKVDLDDNTTNIQKVADDLSEAEALITEKTNPDDVDALIIDMLKKYDANGDGVIGPEEDDNAGLQGLLNIIYKKVNNKLKFIISTSNSMDGKITEIDTPMSAVTVNTNNLVNAKPDIVGWNNKNNRYSTTLQLSNTEYAPDTKGNTYITVFAGTKNITEYNSTSTGLYINNEIIGHSSSYITLESDSEISQRKWLKISNSKIIDEIDNNLTFKYIDGITDPLSITFKKVEGEDTDDHVKEFLKKQIFYITKDGEVMKDSDDKVLVQFDDTSFSNSLRRPRIKVILDGPGQYDFYDNNLEMFDSIRIPEYIPPTGIPTTANPPTETPPPPTETPSPTSPATLYNINTDIEGEAASICRITVSKTAKENDLVYITPEIFEQHSIDEILVHSDDTTVTFDKFRNKFKFTMPAKDVTISVTKYKTTTSKPTPVASSTVASSTVTASTLNTSNK